MPSRLIFVADRENVMSHLTRRQHSFMTYGRDGYLYRLRTGRLLNVEQYISEDPRVIRRYQDSLRHAVSLKPKLKLQMSPRTYSRRYFTNRVGDLVRHWRLVVDREYVENMLRRGYTLPEFMRNIGILERLYRFFKRIIMFIYNYIRN